MRKPSTISLKNDDNLSDTFSTSAPASTQAYLEDVSPQDSYNKDNSDESDCFSDSSKKIRKKRNAYSKIPDDIRMKLLDCVKNGETLKSAAKRFKINYSSAKSILHTFRKEGRILKKSAQERTTKKKSDSLFDLEQSTPRSARLTKKHSVNLTVEKNSRSMNSLNGKGVLSRDTTPAGSLTRLDEAYGYDQQRTEENQMRSISGMEQEVNHGETYAQKERKMSYQEEGNNHHYGNKMGYYMNYNEDMMNHHHQQYQYHHDRNYMVPQGVDQGHFGGHYTRGEYDSFNDMVSALHHRSGQVDEFFSDSNHFLHQRELNNHMDEKFFKTEHGHDFHESGENGQNWQLKSFMDTQSMFRDALKKGTHVSYSNTNNAGFRKGSIDLF